MMLIEDGRIALDDPVNQWLPELASPTVVRTPASPISDVVPAAQLDSHVDKLTSAMLKAPRISLTSAKEYVRTGPDMSTAGAVEYARNLHAVINAADEIRKPRG